MGKDYGPCALGPCAAPRAGNRPGPGTGPGREPVRAGNRPGPGIAPGRDPPRAGNRSGPGTTPGPGPARTLSARVPPAAPPPTPPRPAPMAIRQGMEYRCICPMDPITRNCLSNPYVNSWRRSTRGWDASAPLRQHEGQRTP